MSHLQEDRRTKRKLILKNHSENLAPQPDYFHVTPMLLVPVVEKSCSTTCTRILTTHKRIINGSA